jgi:REP element-mobilizing transposase RayT
MYQRRSIRLKDYDYSQAGAYFVTLCTVGRECFFGSIIEGTMQLSPLGIIVRDCWNDMQHHFPDVEFEIFVVMPNHFHGIIVITTDTVGAIHVQRTPSGNCPYVTKNWHDVGCCFQKSSVASKWSPPNKSMRCEGRRASRYGSATTTNT